MAVPKGKLIPIGGSEAKDQENTSTSSELRQSNFFESGILAEFLAEVNGENSRIEVIPAASEIPEEMGQSYLDAFAKLGCKHVHVMYIDSPEDADKRENLERIDKADGVLFTGGDQTRLVDKLLDTVLLAKIHERYQQDNFVIAGTSAGAAAMPRLAIKEGKSAESLIKGMVETEKGLSLLPEAIIDTHFMQRSRFPRLTEALLRNPGLLGIGLCIDSGVVISQGDVLRAIGTGGVFVIDADNVRDSNYYEVPELQPVYVNNLRVNILAKGASYFLKDRIFTRTAETSFS
ncbi:cyanophycinase [Spirosoma linguale]|uniref:Cyanophycinase n=1 Tax=Spirosoma linguale (strain ATCC 33905 / DSM 74 / LMG 10896 / Claus 1) TaxID=504472 RepID=D2QJU4_SPILD|nr:cyanophycinase [Spirosoma linguale DSM 74]